MKNFGMKDSAVVLQRDEAAGGVCTSRCEIRPGSSLSNNNASTHLMTALLGTKLQKPLEQLVIFEGFSPVIGRTMSEAASDCAVCVTPLKPLKSWHVCADEKKVLQVKACAGECPCVRPVLAVLVGDMLVNAPCVRNTAATTAHSPAGAAGVS